MAKEYLHADLSDEALRRRSVSQQFRRLHGLDTPVDDPGLLRKLLGNTRTDLTYEFLLVAPGGDQPDLDYYISCTPTDALETLATVCRQLFPPGYRFEQTTLDLDADLPDTPIQARQLYGRADRRDDWQTRLQGYDEFREDDSLSADPPLASAAATLAKSPYPAVYQALLRPKADYAETVDLRRLELKDGTDTLAQKLWRQLVNPDREPVSERLDEYDRSNQPMAVTSRLDSFDEKDPRNAFTLTSRAVVFERDEERETAPDAEPAAQSLPTTGSDAQSGSADGPAVESVQTPHQLCRTLGSAFSHVDGEHYAVDVVETDPDDTWAECLDRSHASQNYDRLYTKLPWTANRSPAIIADPGEAASFCLFGGDTLPDATHQAVAPTPSERTHLQPPPTDHLEPYRAAGLTLGTFDGEPESTPALPPSLQPLHVAWYGPSGSGKSVALARAALDNASATDGADIFILPKGAGMATDYLRAYYARYGDLDDVYYLDCSETLPALTFFDIRADLAAGIPRETAIENRIDHYLELVEGLMTADEDAKRAPDVIRYLIKALFDPVHGSDAFSHGDLHAAARRLRDQQSPPPVSDDELEALLGSVVHDAGDTFTAIMQGVLTRIEKVPADRRLARVFNHVTEAAPGEAAAQPGDTQLDLTALLNEDVTILLDMGELGDSGQRALSLAVLSALWSACKQRELSQAAPPLVNCYIEEAATVAETDLLADLVSQGRAFGLSITLAMQFPAQLRQRSPRIYAELLNDVGTIITGAIGHDRDLAERLATDDMDADAVAARLRGLDRGQWLVDPAAPFGQPSPRPFELRSAAPPAAHPASDESLSEALELAFESRLRTCIDRTQRTIGLPMALPSTTEEQGASAPEADTADADADLRPRVDSALPYTNRLPAHLRYDTARHGLVCTTCETWYEPTADGLEDAIDCHPEGAVDPDDVPICQVNLPLDREERRESDWTDAQLMFLRAVYRAHQRRYSAPCYDLLSDSMVRLREYIDIDPAAVDELLEAGLLRHDADRPHRLYTVTATGRDAIDVDHRRGVAHGHGQGDLGESTQHVMGVIAGERLFEQRFVQDPDSPVVETQSYYDLDAGDPTQPGSAERLDLVGLDADGDIVVTGEVERINNDIAAAVPHDFDKMASCDPEEAIWIVMSQSAGHDVLEALNDPPDGEPRVEKTYAEKTPPQQYRLDASGATGIYPFHWLRRQLESDAPEW